MIKYIEKIADRVILGNDTDWNMNINHFDWVPGVGLHGIYTAYEATKDEKYLNFLINWIDQFLPSAYEKKTVNSTAPLLTVLDVYKITGNPEYLKVCIDIAEYILNEAPLTREGGIEHTVTEAVEGFSEQIWADTLFMVCIFLTKLGVCVHHKYSDFAINQLKIHLKLLCDNDSGLFYHGWNCEAQNHMSAIRWGRANAWIIYSSTTILELLGDFDGRDEIEQYIVNHAAALQRVMREDGSFGTILDDITSYGETSAAGGIVGGIKKAVNLGIIDKKYESMCDKGVENIVSMIDDDGNVLSVSTGTPVMPNAQSYKDIPAVMPTLYGQALAICGLI